MPGLDHQDPEGQITKNWAVSLYAVLILFSYGAFGLCAIASGMYLIQERHLKTHNILAILSKLPSIERLESIASRLVLAGVILLSVGLSFAPFLGQPDRPLAWYQDAKVIWSIVIWATYVGVVSSRYLWRFGGRPMAWALIACFVFLILTFSDQPDVGDAPMKAWANIASVIRERVRPHEPDCSRSQSSYLPRVRGEVRFWARGDCIITRRCSRAGWPMSASFSPHAIVSKCMSPRLSRQRGL